MSDSTHYLALIDEAFERSLLLVLLLYFKSIVDIDADPRISKELLRNEWF